MINKLRHCDSEYIEMSIPSGLQAQPVVAGPVSPTQHLSEFLSEFLENSVSNSRTLKFIYKRRLELPHKIPKVHSFGSWMCDIVSLYTSIFHDLGLKAFKFWVVKYQYLVPARTVSPLTLFSKQLVLFWTTTTSNSMN